MASGDVLRVIPVSEGPDEPARTLRLCGWLTAPIVEQAIHRLPDQLGNRDALTMGQRPQTSRLVRRELDPCALHILCVGAS